jgi:hypothetical protein
MASYPLREMLRPTIYRQCMTIALAALCCCLTLAAGARSDDGPIRGGSPLVTEGPSRDIDAPPDSWTYEDDDPWLSAGPEPGIEPPGRMFSRLPQHPLRHLGFGAPLQGTSWLNRPYYVGAFGGSWLGDNLVSGEVDQGSGFLGGYWLGTDMNHYWGSELRASLFYINTSFPQTGQSGVESRNFVADMNLLYHPWGDSRFRPYGSIGLGIAGFHFAGQDYAAYNHTGLSLPVGFGFKYLCRSWLAVRLDIKDNIVFGGNGVDTTGNWSFVGGVELHWGHKSSTRYYPW